MHRSVKSLDLSCWINCGIGAEEYDPRLSYHFVVCSSTPSIVVVCRHVVPRPWRLITLSVGKLHPGRRFDRTVPRQAIPCLLHIVWRATLVHQLSQYILCHTFRGIDDSRRNTMLPDALMSGCPGQGSIFLVYISRLWMRPNIL